MNSFANAFGKSEQYTRQLVVAENNTAPFSQLHKTKYFDICIFEWRTSI